MNDHDIQILAIGITIGIYVMLLVQVIGGVLDDRRDRKAIRAAEAELKAAQQAADA
jgi:hypothetical protein